jgi:omega-hydroxy-beta-dihydromenaquinone-9 sulfotransferase
MQLTLDCAGLLRLICNCQRGQGRDEPMSQISRTSMMRHPFAFGSFRSWLRLLGDSGGVDRAYIGRLSFVLLMSLLTGPLRLYERARYREVIETLTLPEPPIFILGHWRSGTTYLHYLLAQDRNFGYVSTFQGIAPDLVFVGDRTLKPVFAKGMPPTRIIDNMSIALDGPQEEEYAIAGISPYSFYHHWTFPRKARDYFSKYVLFQDVPASVIRQWQEIYLTVLRKAALHAGNQQLLLKSPVNTARIRLVLAMFPHAKFIHVYRNPYVVFLSTRNMLQKLLAIAQLQTISLAEIEADILLFYRIMMQTYLAERALIQPGNLVEVKYEDLEAQPLNAVHRVYQSLDLPGFADAEAAFRAFIASQAGYQKGTYELSDEVIAKVNRHWGFALEAWEYPSLA